MSILPSFEVHGTAASAKTLIALHGVGSSKEGFNAQIAAVTGIGWRLVTVDAPGYGKTPLPQEAGFDPHVETVLSVMEVLDIESAVLLGHSLGGMTAQEIAAKHPERVSALVLSATSPAFGRPGGDFQKEFLRSRLQPFDEGMNMAEFAKKFVPALLGKNAGPKTRDTIINTLSLIPVDTYRLAVETITRFDQRQNLGNISVPVLLLAGEEDRNAPSAMMQKMAEKIAGADFIELPDTGHMAPVENPALFNTHLTDFLKRIA